jgi:hypothetical protein
MCSYNASVAGQSQQKEEKPSQKNQATRHKGFALA